MIAWPNHAINTDSKKRRSFLALLFAAPEHGVSTLKIGEEGENAMEFEWDENKRLKTLRERKIDFIDMIDLWDDPKRQEVRDLRHNYGEPRYQTIGR